MTVKLHVKGAVRRQTSFELLSIKTRIKRKSLRYMYKFKLF